MGKFQTSMRGFTSQRDTAEGSELFLRRSQRWQFWQKKRASNYHGQWCTRVSILVWRWRGCIHSSGTEKNKKEINLQWQLVNLLPVKAKRFYSGARVRRCPRKAKRSLQHQVQSYHMTLEVITSTEFLPWVTGGFVCAVMQLETVCGSCRHCRSRTFESTAPSRERWKPTRAQTAVEESDFRIEILPKISFHENVL